MRRIYVVGWGKQYANWMEGEIVDKIKDADLVVFTGGEDVSPILYGDTIGRNTRSNYNRDMKERSFFNMARMMNKHMIGICRGAQLLCVFNGGRLVQHQEDENYIHPLITYDNAKVNITSSHHQSQFPYNMHPNKFKVLAWTPETHRSKIHLNGEDKEISKDYFREVEICYYPETKCLGIQGHPEYPILHNDIVSMAYYRKLLTNHLENKL